MDSISVAKLVSIGASLVLTGDSFASSYRTLPILASYHPSTSAPIFAKYIYRGTKFLLPAVFTSVGASAYLAFSLPQQQSLWIASAVCVFLILPYTPATIGKRMQRLVRLGQNGGAQLKKASESGEAERLFKAYTFHSWIRTGFLFLGGVVGLLAAIGAEEK